MLGSIFALSTFPLVLASVTWSVAAARDEVQRASAFEGFAWGALVGLGLIWMAIVLIRFTPAVSDWLQASALGMSRSEWSPAALGFVFGAAFSLLCVWTSMMSSRALWWARRR